MRGDSAAAEDFVVVCKAGLKRFPAKWIPVRVKKRVKQKK